MPGLARKVLVYAAVDGLIVHPIPSKKDARPPPAVKIRYGDAVLSSTPRDPAGESSKSNPSFEAFGIVGMFYQRAPRSVLTSAKTSSFLQA